MPRKRFSAAEIVNKLREAEVLIAQDQSVAQVCKQIGLLTKPTTAGARSTAR